MKSLEKSFLFLLAIFFTTSIAFAQGDIDNMAEKDTKGAVDKGSESKDDKNLSFFIHGYVQANVALVRNDDNNNNSRGWSKWHTSKYEFQRIGAVTQLEIEGNAYDKAHFFTSLRLEYNAAGEKTSFLSLNVVDYNTRLLIQADYWQRYASFNRQEVNKKPEIQVREGYVDVYGKNINFRAGQQMITWGEIEGIEAPSDIIMPWDYTTKSTVFEDSRLSVTAANLNFFMGKQKLEMIWMPLFQPAKFPMDIAMRKGANRITRPKFELRNGEYASRLTGTLGGKFRYGLGFLYGFDDMPDIRIRTLYNIQAFPVPLLGSISFPVPAYMDTDMTYNRVLVPTLDWNIAVGDLFSWKFSGAYTHRKDYEGKIDEFKNSSAKYLTGIETPDFIVKTYLAFYVGQDWIMNYTPVSDYDTLDGIFKLMNLKRPNKDALWGFDQLYPYKWLVSCNIQRSFFQNSDLDIGIRFALSANPKWSKVDYVVNTNIAYKITNGVTATLGMAMAQKMNEDKNMAMLELRYAF
jgi:hypothetical protein